MGVNVDYFLRYTNAIANKSQAGQSVTVDQKNIFFNQAVLSKFEADRTVFIQTGNLTKYLTFYLKNVVKQVPPTGNLPYPSDWQHTVAVRSYFIRKKLNPATGLYEPTSVETSVKESKDLSWGDVQISSLLAPSARWPKYMEFANEFRFLPKSIGTVYLDYLKTPTPAKWGYTTVNSRPVYDPITSVDFEFEEFSLNEIAMLYLQLIGINIQMPDLINFAESFKQESKSEQ